MLGRWGSERSNEPGKFWGPLEALDGSERAEMTVISTLITRVCTAHASDSFLTRLSVGGCRELIESQQSKLVRVPAWRGVMGYWGLAEYGPDWRTIDWLRHEAGLAATHDSPEAFAMHLACTLNTKLGSRRFRTATDRGLGIHFSAYEFVEGVWIPELFLISNWIDPTYSDVNPVGWVVSRDTYGTINDGPRLPEHREPKYRRRVHEVLHAEQGFLIYNNGDPILFNPIARTVFDALHELAGRRWLRDSNDMAMQRRIVRQTVTIVSGLVRDFVVDDRRVVGGKPHALAVSPLGIYLPSTGD